MRLAVIVQQILLAEQHWARSTSGWAHDNPWPRKGMKPSSPSQSGGERAWIRKACPLSESSEGSPEMRRTVESTRVQHSLSLLNTLYSESTLSTPYEGLDSVHSTAHSVCLLPRTVLNGKVQSTTILGTTIFQSASQESVALPYPLLLLVLLTALTTLTTHYSLHSASKLGASILTRRRLLLYHRIFNANLQKIGTKDLTQPGQEIRDKKKSLFLQMHIVVGLLKIREVKQ